MRFTWTPEMIRFMEDASQHSDYFKNLADLLSPYLDGCRTVCDAGCGLGQLSEQLGKRGFDVTAADISEQAIAYVLERDYQNVKVLNCDLLSPDCNLEFDAMVFNYFGSIEQILEISNRMCKGPVLIIKKNYTSHRFSFSDNPINGYLGKTAADYLTQSGIVFEEIPIEMEIGQPFRSMEDAVRFFEIYSKDQDRSLISEVNVRSRLVTTENPDFPYYLPHKKQSLLFCLRRSQG